jgi:hypothetical protein
LKRQKPTLVAMQGRKKRTMSACSHSQRGPPVAAQRRRINSMLGGCCWSFLTKLLELGTTDSGAKLQISSLRCACSIQALKGFDMRNLDSAHIKCSYQTIKVGFWRFNIGFLKTIAKL